MYSLYNSNNLVEQAMYIRYVVPSVTETIGGSLALSTTPSLVFLGVMIPTQPVSVIFIDPCSLT